MTTNLSDPTNTGDITNTSDYKIISEAITKIKNDPKFLNDLMAIRGADYNTTKDIIRRCNINIIGRAISRNLSNAMFRNDIKILNKAFSLYAKNPADFISSDALIAEAINDDTTNANILSSEANILILLAMSI